MKVEDITLAAALKMLEVDDTMLVDVRTEAEWQEVGVIDMPHKVILLSLLLGQDRELNLNFLSDLQQLGLPLSTKLIFLCKSGGRSAHAANMAAGLGYECYNVADGYDAMIAARSSCHIRLGGDPGI